jgi:RNA polymerase sigma-70 factor (ECF subfamily)
VAIDHYRRRRVHAPLEAAEHVADASDPPAQVEQRESFARLAHLIEQLPERDQELIALKYGADLNNRAIARQLGLSETNVGSILHRAVAKLRAGFGPEGSA